MSDSLAGRKIAITGGAGFIGHHMALALKKRGASVDVIDSLQVNNLAAFASNPNSLPNRVLYVQLLYDRLNLLRAAGVPLHVLDLRDYQVTWRLLDELKPDTVIHLAAVAHANTANKDPYSTFDHSLRTLENVLDANRSRRPHFIYFSSSSRYGCFSFVNPPTQDSPVSGV